MRTEGLESARFASFAELIVLQYGLGVVFIFLKMFVMLGSAPWFFTVVFPGLMAAICVLRGIQWARLPTKILPDDVAAAAMKKSSKLVVIAGCMFIVNDVALYLYSDTPHRAFMVVVMMMACVCQLFYFKYLPVPAAATATMFAATPVILVFLSGDTIITAMALLMLSVIAIMSYAVYRNHSEFMSLIATHSQLRRLGDENARLASVDMLTGLPNRREFFKALAGVHKTAATSDKSFALGIVDLDGFKAINDTWGHKVGDDVLSVVAARMQEVIGCRARAYRLAGDEFAFIVEEMPQPEFVKLLSESIIASVSQPLVCKGNIVIIGCSIGVAFYPGSAEDMGKLYEAADEALYTSKDRGRGCVTLYAPKSEPTLRSAAG